MIENLRRWLALLAGAVACQAALADRSRIGDEVDVIEFGDCEVELAMQQQRARGAARERETSLQLGCGVGWRTELALAFARTRSEGANDDELAVEAKTSLVNRGTGGIGWTLAYGAGMQRAGHGPWRRSERFVALEATHEPAPAWLLEAMLGTSREPLARRDRTLWLLGVEHALSTTFEARAELGGDDREPPIAGVALRWLVVPELAVVTLSYGARLAPTRERRVGLGVTFEF